VDRISRSSYTYNQEKRKGFIHVYHFSNGGAGFIGSHISDALIDDGHKVVVVDDLSQGNLKNLNPNAVFYRLDICDPSLELVFEKERPEYVCHHAAQIDVRKSVVDPMYDARVNINGFLNILSCSVKRGVKG